MQQLPFQLRYVLTRSQRLGPHLRLWRLWGPVALVCVGGTLAGMALTRSWWFVLPLLMFLCLFRGFFIDLLNVLRVRRQPMDLVIEGGGLGFLEGEERWWIFLDSLLAFDELAPGVWTLRHANGSIVHIPKPLLTDEQVEFFRERVAKGDSVRIEQGIQALTRFSAIFMRGNRLRDPGE